MDAQSTLWSHQFLASPPYPPGAARAPPESEYGRYSPGHRCATFTHAKLCGLEWDEWVLVDALVRPDDAVLELGARWGTTSCWLAKATNNSGRVLSVEPQWYAVYHASRNRAVHRCAFHLLHGTVGARPQRMVGSSTAGDDYGTRTVAAVDEPRASSSHSRSAALPHFSVAEAERRMGLAFSVALVDCEGCIDDLFSGEGVARLLQTLRLVIIEQDASDIVDYTAWGERLRAHGFERVWLLADSFPVKRMRHSAWQRGGLLGRLSCHQYAARVDDPDATQVAPNPLFANFSAKEVRRTGRALRCMDPTFPASNRSA
jgi:FkbM family methyltransferase